MMHGPGAEYVVILSDPQVREGVMRQHSRAAVMKQQSRTRQKAIPFRWIRQIWLKLVPSERVMAHEPAPQASEPRFAAQAAPLFGALD